MFVDYLKPRRKIVNSLRCDTAPWLARRPACPWRRAGGAEPFYDHFDFDDQYYNDQDNLDNLQYFHHVISDYQNYIITMILMISITLITIILMIVITITTIILMIRRSTMKTLQCLFPHCCLQMIIFRRRLLPVTPGSPSTGEQTTGIFLDLDI